MLSDEQHELRATFRRFAEREIAPHAAEADERSEYPWKSFAAYRDSGFVSLAYPGGVRRRRRRHAHVRAPGRGGRPRVRLVVVVRDHLEARDDADPHGRQSRAPSSLRPTRRVRGAAGELLPVRARRRERRREHEHASGARRRPLRAARHEGVDHERRRQRPLRRLRQDRPGSRAPGDQRVRRRARHAGAVDRRARGEDGHARLADL